MSLKRPSILFPDKQTASDLIEFSGNEVRTLCNLNPFMSLAGSMCNYIVQKNRTTQAKKQYAAMTAAVDAEYTELENQAYIRFQELTKQLCIEFKAKSEQLKIEIQRAEAEADRLFLEQKITFETCFKKSSVYKKIFMILKESADRIATLIQLAEKEDIATNTKHYIKLCEQYRILMRGIAKYSKLLA